MSRPVTPGGAVPPASTLSRSSSQRVANLGSRPSSYLAGDNSGVETKDHLAGAPQDSSILSQSTNLHDGVLHTDDSSALQRSDSQLSQSATAIPSRGGTLKKKASLKRGASLKRSGSKKSSYAGSVRSLRLGEKEKYESGEETSSAFFCPVPITGSPTDLLADRFQAWRKVLKDLINYFRDLQKSYESRSKTLVGASNAMSNVSMPSNFSSSGGIAEAHHILRDFHKLALAESNKSKELENEVILQLTGLRSDLQQKIKEIKSLSGDFKNSVAKEQDATKKAVRTLQDSLGSVDHDAATTAGKGDPFLVKLSVDRQVERQIEEENYLHRAYLNLEASGRELESIVVGEIQKAYNVLANIIKREADHSYETAEKLREGPIALPKDHEWDAFVTNNDHMVDPKLPLRHVGQITYSGKNHPAAIEVRSGMLERKSKYLKNYTPGWYVLSPTHLHEFKSADRLFNQSPVMSLYLPEQKLGTHSEPGSSSHKFMLKGRQTGTMHRGHSWIFRAETHDTMLAWFNDLKELTEKRGEARNEFVRRTHARTLSSSSGKAPSIGSTGSGMEDDEADQVAFSTEQSIRGQSVDNTYAVTDTNYDNYNEREEQNWRPQRPTPGGRFPSDLNVQRGLQLAPSSGDSIDEDQDTIAAASALPGSGLPFVNSSQPHTDLQQSHQPETETVGAATNANTQNAGITDYTSGEHRRVAATSDGAVPVDTASTYGEWMAPITTTAVGLGAGAAGATALNKSEDNSTSHYQDQETAIPAAGQSSAPLAALPTIPVLETIPVTSTRSDHTDEQSSTALTAQVNSLTPTAEKPRDVSVQPATTVSTTTETVRPSLQHSAKSVQTISDLHVPGEYPKSPAA